MKVIREIARGGFGVVEEVRLPSGDTCARKTFSPRIILTEPELDKFKKRFRREVRIQSSLPTDLVVPVIRSELDGDQPYFLMPIADQNYREKMASDNSLGEVDVGPLADILTALDELHQLGLVHRDLKPENVLLHEGRWKLSDFGLVLAPSESATRLTSTASAWGTEAYCAPEQRTAFREVGPGADIYSFGCILHDIVVRSQRIPFQQYVGPDPLGPIISKCTESDPERRFESISRLRSVLLTELSSHVAVPRSERLAEWIQGLNELDDWDSTRFEEFARFVRGVDAEEIDDLCRHIDEERLAALHAIDAGLWGSMMEAYCSWATGPFEFEYCDVVVPRFQVVFELGGTDVKARAALAAASLGRSHNRWAVMRQVLRMCGPELDDTVARRIALEIKVESRGDDFSGCAAGINLSINSFHKLIAEALGDRGI